MSTQEPYMSCSQGSTSAEGAVSQSSANFSASSKAPSKPTHQASTPADSSSSSSDDDASGSSSPSDHDDDSVEVVAPPTSSAPSRTRSGARGSGSAPSTKGKGKAIAGPAETGGKRGIEIEEDGDDDTAPDGGKKQRSNVWGDFVLCSKDNKFAVCKHCPEGGSKGRIKRCGGTKSMRNHRTLVHSAMMVARGEKDSRQRNLDGKVQIAPRFNTDALKWMLMTYQPLGATADKYFRSMIGSVSRVMPANRNGVYEGVNNMQVAALQETRKLLDGKNFGASTDIWTGPKSSMYISITVHICDGTEMRTIDLACAPFEVAHNGVNIAQILKDILIEKGIDPMTCSGITMDNAANMLKAGEVLKKDDDVLMPRLSCFCHSLQLVVHRFIGVAKVKGAKKASAAASTSVAVEAAAAAAAAGNGSPSGVSSVGASASGVGTGAGTSPAGAGAGVSPAGAGASASPAGAGAGASRDAEAGASQALASASQVHEILTLCNSIITAYNKSPKSTKLLEGCADWLGLPFVTLKKMVVTRWWSDVTMLHSMLTNRKAIEAQVMKGTAPVPDSIRKLDWGLMEALVTVLEPFAAATEIMEADKHPTISFVLGMVCLLRKEVAKLKLHSNPAIGLAAADMGVDLNQRYTLDPFDEENTGTSGCHELHLAAAVLDPRTKLMPRVPIGIQNIAHSIVEDMADDLIEEKLKKEFDGDVWHGLDDPPDETVEGMGGEGDAEGKDAGGEDGGGSSGGKGADSERAKPQTVMDKLFILDSDDEMNPELMEGDPAFEDWGNYDTAPEPVTKRSKTKEQYQAQMKAELLRYRALGKLGRKENPLAWWAQQGESLPLLKELALRILCVPASSASSERLFSKAGLILTKKRAKLKGPRVAQLVTVRGAIASGLLNKY